MMLIEELTDWLRADEQDEEMILALEAAAVDLVERYSGQRLGIPDEVTEAIAWRGGVIQLTNRPRGAVTLERWAGGAWEAVGADSYHVDGRLLYWTGAGCHAQAARLRATYEAGYPAGGEPEVAKQAVRMVVAHWWENREAAVTGTITSEMEIGLQMLLRAL